MKALTLTQPWASLVDNQAKKIETRSWYTSYRGPLVIHAAKGYPRWCKETAGEPTFQCGLHGVDPDSLPRGMGLCVVTLVACVKTSQLYKLKMLDFSLSTDEISFGDFSEGRWAWALKYGFRLLPPVPAKGALGLWEWPYSIGLRNDHVPQIVCTACDGKGDVKFSQSLGCFLCAGCAESLEQHCAKSGEMI
jgi:activating signal cointegrator 1